MPRAIPAFVEFVTKLVAALRGHVRIWNTFNEPDTYACCGYLIGEFPPLQKGRLSSFRTVIRHMAEAHEQVCRVIREAGSGPGQGRSRLFQELDVFPALPQSFAVGRADGRLRSTRQSTASC